MTNDLEGRLDEALLTLPLDDVIKEMNEYIEVGAEQNEAKKLILQPFPTVEVSLELVFANETVKWIEGTISSMSFGKGWLVVVETNIAAAVEVVKEAASQKLELVRATVDNATFGLMGELDCSLSFSYGTCSFTVAADEACYV